MEVSIDAKFAKLVDAVCKDAYRTDEPPMDLALWYRVQIIDNTCKFPEICGLQVFHYSLLGIS